MLNADQAPYFETCPRCGAGGLEVLRTHAFCVNCNYDEIYFVDDLLYSIPDWALEAVKGKRNSESDNEEVVEEAEDHAA